MNILLRLRTLWKHWRRRKRIKAVVLVESMNDVPEKVGTQLYLVYRGGQYRRAVFSCPCNCGLRIDLSLSRQQWPHWVVTKKGDSITLDPSVWVPLDQCGSHFFVRQSKIEWV